MRILDWFRPKPPRRFSSTIARDLADAVFALHPAASDRVLVTFRSGVVVAMAVPSLDPARDADAHGDPALLTARVSELVAELARSAAPTAGDELIVMRDRVAWMPSVLTFAPPVP